MLSDYEVKYIRFLCFEVYRQIFAIKVLKWKLISFLCVCLANPYLHSIQNFKLAIDEENFQSRAAIKLSFLVTSNNTSASILLFDTIKIAAASRKETSLVLKKLGVF